MSMGNVRILPGVVNGKQPVMAHPSSELGSNVKWLCRFGGIFLLTEAPGDLYVELHKQLVIVAHQGKVSRGKGVWSMCGSL